MRQAIVIKDKVAMLIVVIVSVSMVILMLACAQQRVWYKPNVTQQEFMDVQERTFRRSPRSARHAGGVGSDTQGRGHRATRLDSGGRRERRSRNGQQRQDVQPR